MLSITIFIILIVVATAGIIFGSDLSRPVNLFPGALIVFLTCAVALLYFKVDIPIIIRCVFFLTAWLAIIVIYLTEKQRPLAKAHQQIDNEVKWWLKQLAKTVFEK